MTQPKEQMTMRRNAYDKEEREKLLAEIRLLRKELRDLKETEKEHREQLGLVEEATSLRKQIVTLEIERDKRIEDHERETREIKHMVGLEKKRQEFEIEQAKRETTVTVREENLTADRKRFEDEMKFTTDRFEKEVGYLKDLMGQVLDRLPTVTVDKTIEGKAK